MSMIPSNSSSQKFNDTNIIENRLSNGTIQKKEKTQPQHSSKEITDQFRDYLYHNGVIDKFGRLINSNELKKSSLPTLDTEQLIKIRELFFEDQTIITNKSNFSCRLKLIHLIQFLYNNIKFSTAELVGGTVPKKIGPNYFTKALKNLLSKFNLPSRKIDYFFKEGLLDFLNKAPPDNDYRFHISKDYNNQVPQTLEYLRNCVVYYLSYITKHEFQFVKKTVFDKFNIYPKNNPDYAITTFSTDKRKQLELMFFARIQRESLFVLDDLRLPIDSIIFNNATKITPISSYNNGWQTLLDRTLKIVRLKNLDKDPKTINKFGWPMVVSYITRGYSVPEPKTEDSLLQTTLNSIYSGNPGNNLCRLFTNCLKNHHNQDPNSKIALALNAILPLKENKVQSCIINDFWTKFCTTPGKQIQSFSLIHECINNQHLSFDIIYSVLQICGFIEHLTESKNTLYKTSIKFRNGKKAIQFTFEENSESYTLLIPFNYQNALEKISTCIKTFTKEKNKSGLKDIYNLFKAFLPKFSAIKKNSSLFSDLNIELDSLRKTALSYLNSGNALFTRLGFILQLSCMTNSKSHEDLFCLIPFVPKLIATQNLNTRKDLLKTLNRVFSEFNLPNNLFITFNSKNSKEILDEWILRLAETQIKILSDIAFRMWMSNKKSLSIITQLKLSELLIATSPTNTFVILNECESKKEIKNFCKTLIIITKHLHTTSQLNHSNAMRLARYFLTFIEKQHQLTINQELLVISEKLIEVNELEYSKKILLSLNHLENHNKSLANSNYIKIYKKLFIKNNPREALNIFKRGLKLNIFSEDDSEFLIEVINALTQMPWMKISFIESIKWIKQNKLLTEVKLKKLTYSYLIKNLKILDSKTIQTLSDNLNTQDLFTIKIKIISQQIKSNHHKKAIKNLEEFNKIRLTQQNRLKFKSKLNSWTRHLLKQTLSSEQTSIINYILQKYFKYFDEQKNYLQLVYSFLKLICKLENRREFSTKAFEFLLNIANCKWDKNTIKLIAPLTIKILSNFWLPHAKIPKKISKKLNHCHEDILNKLNAHDRCLLLKSIDIYGIQLEYNETILNQYFSAIYSLIESESHTKKIINIEHLFRKLFIRFKENPQIESPQFFKICNKLINQFLKSEQIEKAFYWMETTIKMLNGKNRAENWVHSLISRNEFSKSLILLKSLPKKDISLWKDLIDKMEEHANSELTPIYIKQSKTISKAYPNISKKIEKTIFQLIGSKNRQKLTQALDLFTLYDIKSMKIMKDIMKVVFNLQDSTLMKKCIDAFDQIRNYQSDEEYISYQLKFLLKNNDTRLFKIAQSPEYLLNKKSRPTLLGLVLTGCLDISAKNTNYSNLQDTIIQFYLKFDSIIKKSQAIDHQLNDYRLAKLFIHFENGGFFNLGCQILHRLLRETSANNQIKQFSQLILEAVDRARLISNKHINTQTLFELLKISRDIAIPFKVKQTLINSLLELPKAFISEACYQTSHLLKISHIKSIKQSTKSTCQKLVTKLIDARYIILCRKFLNDPLFLSKIDANLRSQLWGKLIVSILSDDFYSKWSHKMRISFFLNHFDKFYLDNNASTECIKITSRLITQQLLKTKDFLKFNRTLSHFFLSIVNPHGATISIQIDTRNNSNDIITLNLKTNQKTRNIKQLEEKFLSFYTDFHITLLKLTSKDPQICQFILDFSAMALMNLVRKYHNKKKLFIDLYQKFVLTPLATSNEDVYRAHHKAISAIFQSFQHFKIFQGRPEINCKIISFMQSDILQIPNKSAMWHESLFYSFLKKLLTFNSLPLLKKALFMLKNSFKIPIFTISKNTIPCYKHFINAIESIDAPIAVKRELYELVLCSLLNKQKFLKSHQNKKIKHLFKLLLNSLYKSHIKQKKNETDLNPGHFYLVQYSLDCLYNAARHGIFNNNFEQYYELLKKLIPEYIEGMFVNDPEKQKYYQWIKDIKYMLCVDELEVPRFNKKEEEAKTNAFEFLIIQLSSNSCYIAKIIAAKLCNNFGFTRLVKGALKNSTNRHF